MAPTRPAFLRTVSLAAGARPDEHPFDVPAVATLDELSFASMTVFVGDNGSGKSTLIEALAVATGFNAEGGNRNLRFETHASHSDLHEHIDIRFGRRPSWGWFLRAETFYGVATRGELIRLPELHQRSHGESFLDLIEDRLARTGLFIMDEPESALSFTGQLRLMALIADAVAAGSQFVIATHSPLLMRFPGARLLSFDGGTIHEVGYDDLEVVALWRRFFDAPEVFLSAVLDGGGE